MKRLLIGAIAFMIGLGNAAWAAEKITWLPFDYPPFFFLTGPQQGTGVCDTVQAVLINQLSAYAHVSLSMPSIPRLLSFLERRENEVYCMPCTNLPQEQHPNLLFAHLTFAIPPFGIVVRKADLAQFLNTPEQQASLVVLLQNKTLIAGMFQDVPYGPQIAPLLKQYVGQPNLYMRTGMNSPEFYQMLLAHRVDYILEFSTAFVFVRQALTPEQQAQLMFLPLLEDAEPLRTYVVCNDIPASRAVMTQINAALLTEEYKTAVTQRLIEFLPENLREEYLKLNLDMIGK